MENTESYKGHTIYWSGYEHQHEERSSDWFWALGVIATSAAVTSILFGNVLFAILIVIAAFTLGILATKEPEIVEFLITDKGLYVGDSFYAYADIRAFWIEEGKEENTLLVDTLKTFAPHLVIPINEVSPEHVREMLSAFAVEEELTEPISHKLLELLGF